jgi:hypothetical protein
MHLRFQLPAEVLPLKVERARLVVKINAPSRRVTIAGLTPGDLVDQHQVESPLDPIRLDITEPRWLALDAEGGLHLNLNVSDPVGNRQAKREDTLVRQRWNIEYLELEVTGRVE